MNIAVDAKENKVTVTGPQEKISAARRIIDEFDKGTEIYKHKEPELKKYSVPAGTADAIAKTLLGENPSLRIVAVQARDELWVMATPAEHFALMEKIKDLIQPGAGSTTQTILLAFSDPTEMAAKLVKFYPSANGGPTIEPGGAGQLSIVVKGTADQIKAVQDTVHAIEGTRPPGGGVNLKPFERRLILSDGSATVLAEAIGKSINGLRGNPVIIQDPNNIPKAAGADTADAGREGPASGPAGRIVRPASRRGASFNRASSRGASRPRLPLHQRSGRRSEDRQEADHDQGDRQSVDLRE